MKTIVSVLTSWGPFGLFLLAILDSAGIPLPAAVDALLVATAALSPTQAYLSAFMATLGSALGSMFLYYVGRRGGRAYLDRVTADGFAKTLRTQFQTYGLISVFIPALLPIPLPLKVFVLSAGALGVSPRSFLLTMLAARIPRYIGLAYLGSQLGENSIGWLKQHVWHLLGVAAVLALVLVLVVRAIGARRDAERTV